LDKSGMPFVIILIIVHCSKIMEIGVVKYEVQLLVTT